MDLISSNYPKNRNKLERHPCDVPVDVDDLGQIIGYEQPHIRRVMEHYFNLGAHPGPSELFILRWAHIHLDVGCADLRDQDDVRTGSLLPCGPIHLLKGINE